MLRNLLILGRYPLKNLVTSYSTAAAQTSAKPVARLYGTACIERMPILTTEMNEIEKRYAEYVNLHNLEKSFLSNHELRHLKDLERAKLKKDAEDDVIIETAVDFEEKCLNELKAFKFADRVAPESEKQEFKNINRIMDRKIIMLVKNKTTNNWEFPSVEWTDGESLRETAERSVTDLAKNEIKFQFIGNAPMGLLKEKQKKTYFFKAQVLDDTVFTAVKSDENRIWVLKEELKNFIKSEEYLKIIQNFILDL